MTVSNHELTPEREWSVNDLEDVSWRNLHSSECGMMAWGTIFGVLTLMVFFAFVTNTIQTVNQKIETQTAADGVAYSSALWMARGMNTLTATNHIIGELNGLYVIHHSFGGKRLDDQKLKSKNSVAPDESTWSDMADNWYGILPTNGNCTVWNTAIKVGDATFKAIPGIPVPMMPFHIKTMSEKKNDPCADLHSTIYRGMRNLKLAFAQAMILHGVGKGITNIPDPFGISKIVGAIIQGVALVLEFKIWQEYLVLIGMEMVVYGVGKIKVYIPAFIDAINLYQQAEVIVGIPLTALVSARNVARFQGAQGTVRGALGPYLQLPVEKEATTHKTKNQLMRASYPWVAYWRRRPCSFMGGPLLILSGTESQFRKWSNEWARQNCERLRLAKGVVHKGQLLKVNGTTAGKQEKRLSAAQPLRLYVMKELNDVGLEDGTPVVLYQHIDYGGYRIPLQMGRHTLRGNQNNDCSSLIVTGGYRVTVYDGNFSGASRTYTGSASYVGEDFNDMMSTVLVERNPDTGVEKGEEDWAKNSARAALKADHYFTMIGFAKRPKNSIVAPTFFRQENPNGYACYAQAMFYNANPQEGGGGGPGETQPVVGWDTLNWDFKENGSNPIEYVTETDFTDPPRIKPNWQAKLCPLSAPQMGKAFLSLTVEPNFVPDPMPSEDREQLNKILGTELDFDNVGGNAAKAGAQVLLNNH